jgi:hypothetical protein
VLSRAVCRVLSGTTFLGKTVFVALWICVFVTIVFVVTGPARAVGLTGGTAGLLLMVSGIVRRCRMPL